MKEVKTTIDALEVGMYVSRLDRPWIDTPFVLEGIRIKSKDDIEGLRKYTSFVFVDTEQGPTPDPEHWISVSEDDLAIHDEDAIKIDFKQSKSDDEYKKLRKTFYEIEADFEEELEKAKDIKRINQKSDGI